METVAEQIEAFRSLRDELRDIGVELAMWQPNETWPALTEHSILFVNAFDSGPDSFDGFKELLSDLGPITVVAENFTYQDIVPAIISAHIHGVPPVIILAGDEHVQNCISWVVQELPGKLGQIVWDRLEWKLPGKRAA